MNNNYLILCLFGISVYILPGTVGRESIVGGYLVFTSDHIPYPISLQYPIHNHACGGGFIRNRFILTAARCVVDQNNEFIRGHLFIIARSIFLSVHRPPSEIVQVLRVYVPKEYNPKSDGYYGDIAVLELSEELVHPDRPMNSTHWLEFSKFRGEDLIRGTITITGYGWTQALPGRRNNLVGGTTGRLKFSRARVFADDTCERSYPQGIINPEKHLCAKIDALTHTTVEHGVCTGDTGGLLVRGLGLNATVIGVLSKISPNCDERHRPAIYTRVSHYHEFIQHALIGNVTQNMRMHNVSDYSNNE